MKNCDLQLIPLLLPSVSLILYLCLMSWLITYLVKTHFCLCLSQYMHFTIFQFSLVLFLEYLLLFQLHVSEWTCYFYLILYFVIQAQYPFNYLNILVTLVDCCVISVCRTITCLSNSQILKKSLFIHYLYFGFFAYNVMVNYSLFLLFFLSCRISHFKPLRLNWKLIQQSLPVFFTCFSSRYLYLFFPIYIPAFHLYLEKFQSLPR